LQQCVKDKQVTIENTSPPFALGWMRLEHKLIKTTPHFGQLAIGDKYMKTADTLTTLFSHHLWANLRLLETCAVLTSEQLEATVSGAYGSIYDNLVHIVQAERSYFSRISTGQMYQRMEDAPPLTIADMVESVRTTGSGLIEWASKVQADDMVQISWDGTMRDVPKAILLTQVINHGTEHRAQIMAILTQLGIESPDLQGWGYFDEQYK
jgi:uncharacterized damage-inducible protein DinB